MSDVTVAASCVVCDEAIDADAGRLARVHHNRGAHDDFVCCASCFDGSEFSLPAVVAAIKARLIAQPDLVSRAVARKSAPIT